MNIELTELRLDELSSTTCTLATTQLPSDPSRKVLVAKFMGIADNDRKYEGTYDFIRAMTVAGLAAYNPDGLVFDFRELEYVWGDEMGQVLSIDEYTRYYRIPHVVVVSSKNEEGLTSLFESDLLIDSTNWLFPTLEKAIEAVEKRIQDGRYPDEHNDLDDPTN